MIHLDFYKLFPKLHYIGVDDEQDADCSYTAYNIFVLESRLYPMIYNMFENIEIIIQSQPNKERSDVFLVIRKLENTEDPYVVNKVIDITDEQRKIIEDKILEIRSTYPDYALIDAKELYNTYFSPKKIPFSYFSKMLQYTGIDSSYNPFIQPEGIYLSFNPHSDYKPAYYEVCKFLTKRIQEFYDKGAVVLGNDISTQTNSIIKDWNLVSIDEEEIVKTIYEPNWVDYRFAKDKVDFLLGKIEGDPYIRIKVSDNLVKRHGIVKVLQDNQIPLIFEGSYLKAHSKNLSEAQKIASLVDSVTTIGKVLVIAASRLSEIYLYLQYAKKKGYPAVNYSVDNENSYIFSAMLPNNYLILDELRVEFRKYAVQRLTEISKISKFKNMSPHRIVEEEYMKN